MGSGVNLGIVKDESMNKDTINLNEDIACNNISHI